MNEIEDARVPYLFYMDMMKKEEIAKVVEGLLQERGCFLVGVTVSAENDIEIAIEKNEGTVEMEDCVAVDHLVHETFPQDDEDYSLTVTSAGLDRPFKVLAQYVKAVGSKVTVSLKGGRRMVATLTSADENGIGVSYTALEAVEGKKKKEKVLHEETLPFAGINSVTPYIEFE